MLFIFLRIFLKDLAQTFKNDSFLLKLLFPDFHKRQYENSRNIKRFALKPLKVSLCHKIRIIIASSFNKSIASSKKYFCLVSSLSWPNIIRASSIHKQSCRYLRNIIKLVSNMCSNNVPNDESKESSIDRIQKIICSNIWTFSIGMKHSLKMEG